MKSQNSAFMVLGALSFLAVNGAQASTCSDSVKQAVADQAKVDYPNETLTVVMPVFKFDGGFVQTLEVPVQSANKVIATYSVMIDETCSVEFESKE